MMNDEPASSVDVVAQAPPLRRRETVLALAVIAVVGVFFGLPSLPEPFGVDQGIYGYIGERLLEGAVDHRDVFDHKPPGIHFAYATAFALFGHAMWSVRLLDLFAAIAAAWGLYWLGRKWVGSRMGLICGLVYVAAYECAFDWMSRAQPETWVNLVFVTGLVFVSRPQTRLGLLAAGALLGIGVWFKPTILLLAAVWLPVIVHSAMLNESNPWKHLGFDLLAVGSGALVVCVAVLFYYIRNGAFDDLYEAVVVFNARYHARLGLVRGWREVWQALDFMARPLYGLAVLVLMAVCVAVFPALRSSVALGFGWLVVAFGTVFWQGSFARSHYVLVLSPMAFLAGLAFEGGIADAKVFFSMMSGRLDPSSRDAVYMGRGGFFAVLVACVLLVANLTMLFGGRWTKFSALTSGRISPEQYYASFWHKGAPGKGGYSFQDLRDLGAYLEQQTTPDQTVYVWGFRPLIAYLAHRRMPTRFIFRYPLTRTNDPRWWAEFLSALEHSRPAYFVVMLDDRGLYHPETSKEALENNAALSLFLHGRYELDRTMTDFEIYRLRETKK